MISFEKYGMIFRSVMIEDADFILSLRTDAHLSRFLSETIPNLELQKEWIQSYQKREREGKEYYFIATTPSEERLGLNRIYNITTDSFEIGSWLYKQGLKTYTPILGDLTVRSFAFELLNSKYCIFEVRKQNQSVINYHRRFNPEITGEDELNYYFKLSKENFYNYKEKLLKAIKYGN